MKSAVAALCGVAALATAASVTARADAIHDCQQLADKFKADWNAGNGEAVADLFNATDAMFSNMLWSGTGRDALAAGFKQEIGTGEKLTNITCVHATRVGDLLITDGTWAGSGKGPDGKEASVHGHWMSSARYHGEQVSMVGLVSNTQMPPPAPK